MASVRQHCSLPSRLGFTQKREVVRLPGDKVSQSMDRASARGAVIEGVGGDTGPGRNRTKVLFLGRR